MLSYLSALLVWTDPDEFVFVSPGSAPPDDEDDEGGMCQHWQSKRGGFAGFSADSLSLSDAAAVEDSGLRSHDPRTPKHL